MSPTASCALTVVYSLTRPKLFATPLNTKRQKAAKLKSMYTHVVDYKPQVKAHTPIRTPTRCIASCNPWLA